MSPRHGFTEAGLAVGDVTGVRWWNLTDRELTGSWSYRWQPGENTAECRHSSGRKHHHPIPDEDCGCGFWAYWKQNSAPETGGGRPVLGVVSGYGSTVIGELGFRSAKARIIALCCMFKVMVPDPDWKPPDPWEKTNWEPDPGLFYRGPGGMETWRAMVQPPRPAFQAPLIEDAGASAAILNQLETDYEVPVYSSPEAMLLRHPPTTDYLSPPPEPEQDVLAAGNTLWQPPPLVSYFALLSDHLAAYMPDWGALGLRLVQTVATFKADPGSSWWLIEDLSAPASLHGRKVALSIEVTYNICSGPTYQIARRIPLC